MPEKISRGLHEERTRRINGTKFTLTATVSLSHGLSWPRGFGLCLSKPRLTLDVKVLYKWTKTLSAACWNHKRLHRVHTKNCNHFSRTTLDFQGPPPTKIFSRIVQKCTFPVYSNKALRLELFASPTSLHFSLSSLFLKLVVNYCIKH